MTLEEFKDKCEKEPNWAPGWDNIDEAFAKIYGEQKPAHFMTEITSRAMLGGNEWLDGYSYYTSDKGYVHVVTYGMSELYQEENNLNSEFSRWGYEMTMKLKGSVEDNAWAMDLLSQIAGYTNQTERYFEAMQFIGIDIQGASGKENSKITALLVAPDTEVYTTQTVYGEVQFLQMIGITENEFEKVRADRKNAKILYDKMLELDKDLVIDFDRTIELL